MQLPADMPPGEYGIEAGLYNPSAGGARAVATAPPGQDHLNFGDGAGAVTMTKPDRRQSVGRRHAHLHQLDWLLWAVLATAIFFRFWQIGHIPPGMDFDEAFESLDAQRILTEPGYRPVVFPRSDGVPPLKIYLTALAFLIIGEQMLAIRYVSAAVGEVTVVALYLPVRVLFLVRQAPARPPERSRQLTGNSVMVGSASIV